MHFRERLYRLRPKPSRVYCAKRHGFSEQWERFAVEVCKNEFMRRFLFLRRRGICSCCCHPLAGDVVVHHVDYDHVCTFGGRKGISRSDYNVTGWVTGPDCEACLVASRTRFLACANRLRAVHEECNRLISQPDAPKPEKREVVFSHEAP